MTSLQTNKLHFSAGCSSKCECKLIALPPPDFRQLVAGTEDITTYLNSGHFSAKCIIDLLDANHADVNGMTSILDFGCGAGRILMHLSEMLNKPICGTDFNQKLVAWSSNNIRSGGIYLNEFVPPTEHASSSFDLIYAFSVFTHLSEKSQTEWMDEFARIIKSGGYLIFTTHGKGILDLEFLSEDEVNIFVQTGLTFREGELEGENNCFTVQSFDHVRNVLCKKFELVAFSEAGAVGNPPQDIFLLRRKN